jgi:hypothetical protein
MRLLLLLSLLQTLKAQNATAIENMVLSKLESTVTFPVYYLVIAGGALFIILLICYCYCCCRSRPVSKDRLADPGPVVIGRGVRRASEIARSPGV